MTAKVILNLKHYKVIQLDDKYIVENHMTAIAEYESTMLPSTINTAEALNNALEKVSTEYNLEF